MRLVENNRTPGLIEDPGYNYAARGVNKPGRQQPQTRDMSLAGREREKKANNGGFELRENSIVYEGAPDRANGKHEDVAEKRHAGRLEQSQPATTFSSLLLFSLVRFGFFSFFFCDYFLPSTLVPPCNVLGPLAATAPWKESAHRFSNHIVTFP